MINRLITQISEPLRKNKWLDVQKIVAEEYNGVKLIKNQLHTLKLDMNIEVPLGARRSYLHDEPVRDINDLLNNDLHFSQPNDPDVWPSPTPVDHSKNGPSKPRPG